MKDRSPLYPGRVTLTPVSGQANTYDMARADQPTEAGTPLNKATFLKDNTAALYGLGEDAVPDEALEVLGESVRLVHGQSTTDYTLQNPSGTDVTEQVADSIQKYLPDAPDGSYTLLKSVSGGNAYVDFEFPDEYRSLVIIGSTDASIRGICISMGATLSRPASGGNAHSYISFKFNNAIPSILSSAISLSSASESFYLPEGNNSHYLESFKLEITRTVSGTYIMEGVATSTDNESGFSFGGYNSTDRTGIISALASGGGITYPYANIQIYGVK